MQRARRHRKIWTRTDPHSSTLNSLYPRNLSTKEFSASVTYFLEWEAKRKGVSWPTRQPISQSANYLGNCGNEAMESTHLLARNSTLTATSINNNTWYNHCRAFQSQLQPLRPHLLTALVSLCPCRPLWSFKWNMDAVQTIGASLIHVTPQRHLEFDKENIIITAVQCWGVRGYFGTVLCNIGFNGSAVL